MRKVKNKDYIKGKPLHYNSGIQTFYISELNWLIKRMIDEVSSEVLAFFKNPNSQEFYKQQKEIMAQDESISSQAKILTNKLSEKFASLFSKMAPSIANSIVDKSQKQSNSAVKNSLEAMSAEITLNPKILTTQLSEVVKAAVNENVSLIKSIGQQYLSNVQKQVMRSITTGQGLKDLVPALSRYEGITERHARNMALDQTRKVYNSINRERLINLGIKEFMWHHSGGGLHPRPEHQAMDGKIFKFDDPPIIDPKTKERGFPGQAYNCRCFMTPVVNFNSGD